MLTVQEQSRPAPASDYERHPPVTAAEWASWQDGQGNIVDECTMRDRVFHSGVSEEIRRDVWRYFLHHR